MAELLKYKIDAEQLFKVCKVLFSFNKKDSKVKFVFKDSNLTICSENVIAEFPNSLEGHVDVELKDYSFYCYSSLSILETINKLKKAQQQLYVILEFDCDAEIGNLHVESLGLTTPFAFEPSEGFKTFNVEENVQGYIYSDQFYGLLSKTAAKQKDLNYFLFNIGSALAVGDQQFSRISELGVDCKPETSLPVTLNSTAFNNLIKASNLLSFEFSKAVFTADANHLVVKLPEVKTKQLINFEQWNELCSNFHKQHQFKITNTKQLEQLISTTKRVDALDLCKLELLKDKIAISFFQNKESVGRFEFADLLMELPNSELDLVMQVKHLQSLLLMSNNEVYFEYMHNEMPLYSRTDLGLETFTMLSLIK